MKMISKTRRNLVHLILKLTKQDAHLTVLEVADGTGNGCGCMPQDSVNHNSTPTAKLSVKKDGSGLISDH